MMTRARSMRRQRRPSCAEQPSLALIVHENGRVPAMLAREGVAATVAVATTRNLLELA